MRQESQKWPSIYATMSYWSKQTEVKASPDSFVPIGQIQGDGRVDPISQEKNLMIALFEVKLMYILLFLYPPLSHFIPGWYMLSLSHIIVGCLPLLLGGEYH